MNSRRKQIIKIGIIVLIVVLLGMVLTHCTNTTETKSVKSDKTVEKSKEKVTTKKPGKNKSTDVDKIPNQKENNVVEVSSTDSNASESKKDNTGTSSNKENTGTSYKPSNNSDNASSTTKPATNSGISNSKDSKPAEHTHNWVAVTETRTVVDQAAYDEQVPITEMREICVGNQSGLQINGDPNEYLLNNSNGDSGWHSEWKEVVTRYQTIHHDAVTHTETMTTGYHCSECGKTK